jgi:hypothetical protein
VDDDWGETETDFGPAEFGGEDEDEDEYEDETGEGR